MTHSLMGTGPQHHHKLSKGVYNCILKWDTRMHARSLVKAVSEDKLKCFLQVKKKSWWNIKEKT